MNALRKCIPDWRLSFVAALITCLLCGAPLFAQDSSLAERLPPGTLFYVQWRGSAFVSDAEKKNHVIQLMEDPALAPAWLALASTMQKSTAKQGATVPTLGLADVISLAANSALFGVVENPNYSKAADKKTDPVGIFVVFDAKGKKELIEKLKALSKASGKSEHTVTHYEFGGTTVDDDASAESHEYSAQAGGYYISSNLKPEVEDLITRFRSDSKPATSIVDLPEYKETRKFVGTDAAVEMFGRVPNFGNMIPADSKNAPFAKILNNLHLDRIHAFVAGVSFAGEAMQWRGALLGDASPGSLLDFVGDSGADFALRPVLATNSSFSVVRLNWAALYQVIRTAVQGNLTPQQSAGLGAAEGMAQGYLGMSIPDALKLISGETATILTFADDGSTQQMFVLTIQKPEEVLRMLRAVVGTLIVSEDTSGKTTFLDLSYPYKDPATGTQRREFYYVAVAPNVIVLGKRKAKVKVAIDALNSGGDNPAATGILTDKEFLELRSKMPEKLSGLGAADYRQFPLDKMIANYVTQMQSAFKQSKDATAPDLNWLKPITADVITRHVHMSVSGTWKDSNGIYFAAYFQ
jgi:hypothetical protein